MKKATVVFILAVLVLGLTNAIRLKQKDDPQACKSGGNMMLPSQDANFENCKQNALAGSPPAAPTQAAQPNQAAGGTTVAAHVQTPSAVTTTTTTTTTATATTGTGANHQFSFSVPSSMKAAPAPAQQTAPADSAPKAQSAAPQSTTVQNLAAQTPTQQTASPAPASQTPASGTPATATTPTTTASSPGGCTIVTTGGLFTTGYFLNSGQTMVPNQQLISLNGRAKLELAPDCRVGLFYFDRLRWQSPAIDSRECSLTVTNDGKFVLRTKECDYALAQAQNPSIDSIYYQLLITNSGQLELHMTTVEASLKQYCGSTPQTGVATPAPKA